MALVKKLQERYHYSLVVLKELVKTDFKLRYQGSFLGIGWSVLQPLMLFCVMYAVFAKFLRMSDGTPTYPVVLLMGISAWQFVQESTSVGLRAIVDRGDLLRKIHFPNYIVVVASTIGALGQSDYDEYPESPEQLGSTIGSSRLTDHIHAMIDSRLPSPADK